jgi:hypothetical protein
MKISKRKKLILFSSLAILIISAASFLKNADDSNPLLGMQIYRLEDGTTQVVNSHHGFQFSIPSGWYALLLPPSPEEIEKFNVISQQNNLTPDPSLTAERADDDLILTIVNLNSESYKGGATFEFELIVQNVTEVVPSGALPAFVELLKASGRVTSTQVTSISGQDVGLVEFRALEDDPYFIGGKVLAFIRNGNLYAILGQADNEETVHNIEQAMDDIYASLKFYDVK